MNRKRRWSFAALIFLGLLTAVGLVWVSQRSPAGPARLVLVRISTTAEGREAHFRLDVPTNVPPLLAICECTDLTGKTRLKPGGIRWLGEGQPETIRIAVPTNDVWRLKVELAREAAGWRTTF